MRARHRVFSMRVVAGVVLWVRCVLGRLGGVDKAVVSPAPLSVTSVSPVRFPREVATELVVKGSGFTPRTVIAIDGLSGNLYSEDLSLYRPMRSLNATYVDSETVLVTSVPSQNAGPCSVRASPDGSGSWTELASAPVASAYAALEVALSRRRVSRGRAERRSPFASRLEGSQPSVPPRTRLPRREMP